VFDLIEDGEYLALQELEKHEGAAHCNMENATKTKRVRGEGSILRKKGSRFLWVGYYDENGRQIQENSRTTSEREASGFLRRRLQEIEQGVPVEQARKLRYEEIREGLLLDYKTKGNRGLEVDEDGAPYIWGLNHTDAFFRNKRVRSIKTNTLYKFIAKMQGEGLANATINRCLALLKRGMNIARRDSKLFFVPFFPMLKEDNVRTGFIDHAQFTKLRNEMAPHLRPLITFLYFTGCRIGAALSITWSQVELEDGRVLLRLEGRQTKNEEPILLPLPIELGEELSSLPREGKVFDGRNLRKGFQAACVKVGLGVKTGPKVWQYKGLLIHDFRRSGVRNLIRSGVPRRVAMKISGHLTESTFERYNIVDSTDLREAMAKVEKHFRRTMKVR
jgi:integrase